MFVSLLPFIHIYVGEYMCVLERHSMSINVNVCLCGVDVSMPWHVCGDQSTPCGGQFSPYVMWGLRNKFKSSALAATIFVH